MSQSDELSIIKYMLLLVREQNDGATDDRLATAKMIKDFIDEIPGGFLIYRADGNEDIIYANKALIKIFACDSFEEFLELTQHSFKGIVHPGDVERVEESIALQIAGNPDNLDYVEYRIIRKDGIVRWVEDFGHYIHTEEAGNFYYVFISDATEKVTRRMAETAMLINDGKAKDKQLKTIIEEYDRERKLIRQEHLQRLEVIEGLSVNYDSILLADLDADQVLPYRLSMRLVKQFDNRLQVREFSWFLDDYVKVWVHPKDKKFVREKISVEHIRARLQESKTFYLNYRCVYKGEIQYIQLRLVNVSGEKANQIVMGFRNVDEEVLLEMKQKQLLQAALENAKRADVAKNTFLSNMSHDMRTPLNAIFGYITLAQKCTDDPAVSEYLDKISAAGNEILELVNKVLEFSYTRSQNETVNNSECNIVALAEDVCESVKRDAEKKRISVTLDTSEVHNPDVFADANKLAQSLAHIVTNAVKYNKPDGSVLFKVTERGSDAAMYSSYCFTVSDTGIGIDKDYLPRIFDPFERVNNTTASQVFGSGLGLTISKHFIDLMGGTITVESEPDVGSTFTVSVSLRKNIRSEATESKNDKSDIDLKGKHILLAEDNEINLEIETEILTDLGFTIDSAENGSVALEKIKASSPGDYDLVLMDIQMPEMDGRQAARAIRALPDPALSSIPIIALSANALESDRRASIEAGMQAHLTKPIDIPVLLSAIVKTLNKMKK